MWLKKQLLKKFELETLLMGEDDDMVKKAVYLGRTLEWGENGLIVRPDQRHMRSLLRVLGMECCRSISAPLCATTEKEGNRSDRPEVSAELATKHRAAVARVVPRIDWIWEWRQLSSLKRWQFRERVTTNVSKVLRDTYLHGHPDYLQWYPFQEDTDTVVLTTDADWATRKESRRSNSGGNSAVGESSRRRLESCSTGMRGISETLGFVHLMCEFKANDWGRIVHRVDASACRAIMLRRGCGGLKHISVQELLGSTRLKSRESHVMRCMLTSLPLHPVRKS